MARVRGVMPGLSPGLLRNDHHDHYHDHHHHEEWCTVYHPGSWGMIRRNINWKWATILMFYKFIGCQHVLCDFINSWGTNSYDNAGAYLCDISQRRWQGDNVTSGLLNTKYLYYILFTNIFFLLNILFHTNCRDNNSILSVHYKYIITECDARDHEPDRSKLPRIWDLIQF